MARGTDQCGGETSSTNIIDWYGDFTLAVPLPRGCLAGCRRPRVLQTVRGVGQLAASVNAESTSLARRLNASDFGPMEVSVDNPVQSEYGDTRYC